jgi:peptidoglycan/xylan/chitin deacetylase (PgdA/CDA1 family)
LYRLSAVLLALCLGLPGCGIALRHVVEPPPYTPPPGSTTPLDPVASRPSPVLRPVDTVPFTPAVPVVSITFDDGWSSAATGAALLASHGLTGTFFINSVNVGVNGYVTLAQLDTMARAGNEIGGHTLTHPDLTDLPLDEAERQVCNDRVTLLGWGFPVRSFAYPFSQSNPDLERVIADCGYNSARGLGGLRPHLPDPRDPASCSACSVAEVVPPPDPYYTLAPREVNNDWTLDDLKGQVTDSLAFGEGWVPLTFHKLCTADCTGAVNVLPDSSFIATNQEVYDQFLTWLADQQATGNLIVRTVGDVVGGPVKPPVRGPDTPSAPAGVNEVSNPGLEEIGPDGLPGCWRPAGWGNNKAEVTPVPDARSGSTAMRVVVHDYVDGDAKVIQTMDQGTCASTVTPGATYTLGAWYTSTAPTALEVYYRLARGVWVYAATSPTFQPATTWAPASWTLPPIPDGVAAVNFGLNLSQNGTLTTADYSLVAAARP